ncbi:hypothetical protein Y023_1931 [Burkholderia pseudomallei A79D]|nr:hypothetical protein Y023_1931 [Burkholderia pseudomallei A79D]KGY04699.1 hypothetical protein X997_1884 [Burkholderia pseudomallei A79C]
MGKAVRVAHEAGDMLPVPVTTSRVSGLRPRCRAGARSSGLGARGSEFGARSSGLGVRSSGLGVRSSEFGVRSSELGARSSELGTRNSEPVRGARTRRIVGGMGWGGAGRGSGPERAAIGGGERGDAAVSGGARRYWMVFGDVGRPAGWPGAPRRDAYSTPVQRAPARHSSISRTFTRLPLILPALSLRSASRAMPRSTAT